MQAILKKSNPTRNTEGMPRYTAKPKKKKKGVD